MRFQILPDGTLRTPSQPGQCLQSAGAGLQATFQPCAPGLATQQWAYSAATEQISTASATNCLAVGGSGTGSAVIGRPLVDGSWALGFFNAGSSPIDVTCDADCLSGMGFEPSQNFHARDLWAGTAMPDIAAGANVTVPGLDAEGGVALIKLTPFFSAPLPPPPADL